MEGQRKPGGEDLILPCPTIKRKLKERSVSNENRGMKVGVLQVDIYKTILGSDASDDVPLCQHLERKLVKGPIPDS